MRVQSLLLVSRTQTRAGIELKVLTRMRTSAVQDEQATPRPNSTRRAPDPGTYLPERSRSERHIALAIFLLPAILATMSTTLINRYEFNRSQIEMVAVVIILQANRGSSTIPRLRL